VFTQQYHGPFKIRIGQIGLRNEERPLNRGVRGFIVEEFQGLLGLWIVI
jgi:hypothetical protein